MNNSPPFPDSYFAKFSDKPVLIKPFDPKAKLIAEEYIGRLKEQLKDFDVEILHRGSTAFGIAGKGDVEIGIFPSENDWQAVIATLKERIGVPGKIENDYVRFNDVKDNFEVEIILQKGVAAKVDRALTNYLLSSPALLTEYEGIKRKYSYSKREYQVQKDKFLRRIIELIPEQSS